VPDRVDTKFILKANVSCTDSKIKLETIIRDKGVITDVVVDRELFFG